ncbi:MAG: hypothetical protein ACRD6X_14695 [Pyrinomonadaceae bacterium]
MNVSSENIAPETLATISDQAKIRGLSIDEYLRELIPQTVGETASKARFSDAEFELDMVSFAEESGHGTTYSGGYSRKDIYSDHD